MDQFKTKPQIDDLTNLPSSCFVLVGVKETEYTFSVSSHGEENVVRSLNATETQLNELSDNNKTIDLSKTTIIPTSLLSSKNSYELQNDDRKKARMIIIIEDEEEIIEESSVFYIKKSEILKDENKLGKLYADVVMTNTDVKIGMATADSCVINISGLDKNNKIFRCEMNLGHGNCNIGDTVLSEIERQYGCEVKNLKVSVGHYSKARYYVGVDVYKKYAEEYPEAFTEVSNPRTLNARDRLNYNKSDDENKKYLFDWPKITLIQLQRGGVLEENIRDNSLDMFDNVGFSSYKTNVYNVLESIYEIKSLLSLSESKENLAIMNQNMEQIIFFYKKNSYLGDFPESRAENREKFKMLLTKFTEFSEIFEKTNVGDIEDRYKQIRELIYGSDNLFEKLVVVGVDHFTPRNLALSYLEESRTNEQKFSHN